MENGPLLIRVVILGAAGLFVAGMQFGFAAGPGRTALRAVLFLSIMVSVVTAVYYGWEVEDPMIGVTLVGILVVTASGSLFIWSLFSHASRPAKAFAIDAPKTLVKRGAYRLARHPIYLSYILALTGTALLAHSWVVGGLSIWMAGLYWTAARREEKIILASPHRDDYAAYMKDVGMFWPRCY